MTDLAPLKTLIVDALTQASMNSFVAVLDPRDPKDPDDLFNEIAIVDPRDPNDQLCEFDADRLATAIHDHFLNRENVRAALEAVFKAKGVVTATVTKRDGTDEVAGWHLADMIADRLIASLAGGSQ